MARAADLSPIRRKIWKSCRMRVAPGIKGHVQLSAVTKYLRVMVRVQASLSLSLSLLASTALDFDLDHQDFRSFSSPDNDERERAATGIAKKWEVCHVNTDLI